MSRGAGGIRRRLIRSQLLFGDQPPQQADGAGHAEPSQNDLGALRIGGFVFGHEGLPAEPRRIAKGSGL